MLICRNRQINKDEVREACSTDGEIINAYTNVVGKHKKKHHYLGTGADEKKYHEES
jgi:hypothetical protein